MLTVVIDKVSNAYAKKGAIKARVKTCHALSLDDATNGIIARGSSTLGFDLCAGGQRDEWISVRPLSIAARGIGEAILTSRS